MKGLRVVNDFSTAIALIIIVYLFIAAFFQSFTVTNMATLQAASLGIFWDSNCTREVHSIDWGSLYPGSSKTVKMYVRNEGDMAVQLSLNTTDWKPSQASEIINLGWDYTGQTINPNDIIPTALKLSLSSDMKGITAFSFNIVISSEEVPPPPPPPPPPPRDVTPPRVSILSPESGTVINSSSLLLRWVGRDTGSGIDYYSVYLNGELEIETRDAFCELFGLVEGSNSIRVVARDKGGNVGEDEITVIVDTMPPSVSVSSQGGDRVRGTVTVSFSALDENLARIFLQIDDASFDVTGMEYYQWNTSTVEDGTHIVKVIAIDEAGNSNSSSITVWIDNTEPMLSLLSPADGAVVAGSLNVRFSVFDISPVNVLYALDDDDPVDITGRENFNIDTAELANGLHTVKFVVTDILGNSIENTIKIIVDNTLPNVDFDGPVNGSCLADKATISLRANDANLDGIELYISGEMAARWHTGWRKKYVWDTRDCKDGTYVLKAVAYDKAGNTMEKSLVVRIDKSAPNVIIVSPLRKTGLTGIYNIWFSASDMNLAKVSLRIDNDVFDVTGMNSYAWNTLYTNDGRHTIVIRAVDKAGNVAEKQITVGTINHYLAIEFVTGMTFIALMISLWPSVLASKRLIL